MGDYPLSATLKAKSDSRYDAPWIVVYANDPSELNTRIEGVVAAGCLDTLVGADNQLKLLSSGDAQTVQQQPAQGPSWGSVGPQGFQPAQQGQQWGGAVAPQGQFPNPNQPQQPPFGGPQQQQPQGNMPQHGGLMHPAGRQCQHCGKVLVQKKTSNGNAVWRCEDWRWNNGNPNGHDSLSPGEQ